LINLIVEKIRSVPSAAGGAGPPGGEPRSQHMRLRRPLPDFTGRTAETARAVSILAEQSVDGCPVVVLYGMGGVGKTTVANQVAHDLAPTFPYARIMVDLGGVRSPTSFDGVYQQVFYAFGLADNDIPLEPSRRAQMFESIFGRGRCLLVLDNATDAAQVAPLLPTIPGSAAIVTSRSALTGLDGVSRISIGPLPEQDGVRLLAQAADRDREQVDTTAGKTIVTLLGGLPLAIRIAGALASTPAMRARSLQVLAQSLTDEEARLEYLQDQDRGVRASFDISYRALPAHTARIFRLLGLLPGPDFPAAIVAAVGGFDPDEASARLDDLVNAQLVEVVGGAGDRYRLHDLLRLYARERTDAEETPEWRDDAVRRILDWYTEAAENCGQPPSTDYRPSPAALAWFTDEHLNVQAALLLAHRRHEHLVVRRLADALRPLCWYRRRWEDSASIHEYAVEADRAIGDGRAELGHLIYLAEARRAIGQPAATEDLYARALDIARSRDADREAWVLTHYGDLQCDLGRPLAAMRCYDRALEMIRAGRNVGGEIWLVAHMIDAFLQADRPQDAVRAGEKALALARSRDPAELVWVQWHLGPAYSQVGRHHEAMEAVQAAVDYHRRQDDSAAQADMLLVLGRTQISARQLGAAHRSLTEAVRLARLVGLSRLETRILQELRQLSGGDA
jgi:tetratricopeptide (TPR) repeat protein